MTGEANYMEEIGVPEGNNFGLRKPRVFNETGTKPFQIWKQKRFQICDDGIHD